MQRPRGDAGIVVKAVGLDVLLRFLGIIDMDRTVIVVMMAGTVQMQGQMRSVPFVRERNARPGKDANAHCQIGQQAGEGNDAGTHPAADSLGVAVRDQHRL